MSASSPMSKPRAPGVTMPPARSDSSSGGARVATECRTPLSSTAPAEPVSGVPNLVSCAGRSALVIGLGTSFGDDRAGWEVVVRLQDVLPVGPRAAAASDPLVVLDTLPGDELLIVVDACRGAGPEGSVHRFEWPDPRLTAECGVSSHGVRLTAALELAGRLGRLPPRVVVFAVEGSSAEPGAGLSPAVAVVLPEVVDRVLAELAAAPGEPPRSRE